MLIQRFNNWIALNLTLAMGSIWCVYLFFVIAIAPLFEPRLEPFCIYLSTTIIQLVALPAILVGSKILAEEAERRSITQYNAVMETLTDIQQVMECDREELVDLRQIADQLARIEAMLPAKKR